MSVISMRGLYDDGSAPEWVRSLANPLTDPPTLVFARGESVSISVDVFTPSGVPYDLNASSLVATVNCRLEPSTAPTLRLQAVLSSSVSNRGTFTISAGQTKDLTESRYWYDIWLLKSGGVRSPVVGNGVIYLRQTLNNSSFLP